ncbi:MAG: hypothetical protein ABI193_22265 [Minicystis sp.]
MRLAPWTLTAITAVALALSASVAQAEPCRAARAGVGVDSQPDAWREAVAALIRASAAEGQPWSCSGGIILLVTHDQGATLTIVGDDGRAISREISLPEDIEPLGEALLAHPLLPPAPLADAPPADVAPVAKLLEPRVLIDALIAPRYAGGSNVILGGITAGAAVPIGPWLAGVWGRYDGVSAALTEHGGSMTELCVGAMGGRSFQLAPIELRASFTPSVAVVTRFVGGPEESETRVMGRLGLDARGVVPITGMLRAVVALDAEIAPAGFGDERHARHDDDRFSAFPSYTLGFGVGVELAPR